MPLREFLEGDGDSRQDQPTRDRVQELAAGMQAWAVEQERRMHRFGLLLIAMVVGELLAVVFGYLFLQGQRWEQSRDGCNRTNQQAEASVGLLEDLKVRPEVVMVAKVRYPHVPPSAHREGDRIVEGLPSGYDGPMTCEEFATERVGFLRL
jgi:hypothetical protein